MIQDKTFASIIESKPNDTQVKHLGRRSLCDTVSNYSSHESNYSLIGNKELLEPAWTLDQFESFKPNRNNANTVSSEDNNLDYPSYHQLKYQDYNNQYLKEGYGYNFGNLNRKLTGLSPQQTSQRIPYNSFEQEIGSKNFPQFYTISSENRKLSSGHFSNSSTMDYSDNFQTINRSKYNFSYGYYNREMDRRRAQKTLENSIDFLKRLQTGIKRSKSCPPQSILHKFTPDKKPKTSNSRSKSIAPNKYNKLDSKQKRLRNRTTDLLQSPALNEKLNFLETEEKKNRKNKRSKSKVQRNSKDSDDVTVSKTVKTKTYTVITKNSSNRHSSDQHNNTTSGVCSEFDTGSELNQPSSISTIPSRVSSDSSKPGSVSGRNKSLSRSSSCSSRDRPVRFDKNNVLPTIEHVNSTSSVKSCKNNAASKIELYNSKTIDKQPSTTTKIPHRSHISAFNANPPQTKQTISGSYLKSEARHEDNKNHYSKLTTKKAVVNQRYSGHFDKVVKPETVTPGKSKYQCIGNLNNGLNSNVAPSVTKIRSTVYGKVEKVEDKYRYPPLKTTDSSENEETIRSFIESLKSKYIQSDSSDVTIDSSTSESSTESESSSNYSSSSSSSGHSSLKLSPFEKLRATFLPKNLRGSASTLRSSKSNKSNKSSSVRVSSSSSSFSSPSYYKIKKEIEGLRRKHVSVRYRIKLDPENDQNGNKITWSPTRVR